MRFALVGLSIFAGSSWAQQYVISTYAGGAPLPTPVAAVSVPVGGPKNVAVDAAGNAYFTSSNSIFKMDQNGVLTRVAGNSRYGYAGDGGPAISAQLAVSCFYLICGNGPNGLATDGAGNLFVADTGNHRIRRITPDGIITTVAGIGTQGFSGDGGPAVSAQLNAPAAVAVDRTGNVFIADTSNSRIRMVSASGIITTVGGNGTGGPVGDGGPATKAGLYPVAVVVDHAGNLFLADFHTVRKISTQGIITTVAGNGLRGSSGDGGQAASAELSFPTGLAVDSQDNLFIVDYTYYAYLDADPEGNALIRKVSANGIITTVAGNGTPGFSGDGGPATGAALAPSGVAVDLAGNLFIADYGANRLREVSPDGIISTVAGNGSFCCSSNNGSAASAQLSGPTGAAIDVAGNLFIVDGGQVRKISQDGTITTVAGGGQDLPGDGGPATKAQLSYPSSVAVDGAGNLFIAEYGANRVRKVSPNGLITTVQGSGTTNASPIGVAADGSGNLYIPRIAVTTTASEKCPADGEFHYDGGW